jgi:hypothetical protein
MANTLACIALHVWFKLTPILIRSRKAAFGRIGVAAIKSPTINTASTLKLPMFGATSTWGAVPALFETECSGAIALDVVEGVVIGISIPGSVGHFPYVIGVCDTVDARRAYIPDAMFGIVVNHHGNTVDTEMVGEITVVLGVTVGVDASLKRGHDVGIVGWSDSPKEDVGPVVQ